MPHDRNGNEIKPGMIVRGRGYNAPHEITGEVLSVTEGAETCNLCLAVVKSVRYRQTSIPAPIVCHGLFMHEPDGHVRVFSVGFEYGSASQFEVVHDPAAPARPLPYAPDHHPV